MSYAKLIILGRLGRDPETRTLESGKNVVALNVAVNGFRRDDPPTWYTVNVWHEATQDFCERYLHKGDMVLCDGNPSLRTWTDREGAARTSLELAASRVVKAGGSSDNGSSDGGEPSGRSSARTPASRAPAYAAPEGAGTRSAARAPGRGPSPGFDDLDDDIPF